MIIDHRFEFYNADALIQTNQGMQISRFPADVRMGMLPGGRDSASLSTTGCEVRFVMNPGCDFVRITLKCLEAFMVVQLYFGSFQGGWKYLYVRGLTPGENELIIERPQNIEQLRQAAQERGHLFSPDVMRLCFRSGAIADFQLHGDIRPPLPDEVPTKRILFYGSSITHGSLSYLPCNDYASLVCRKFGADLINKGCAGSCRMEPSVAEYLASRNDYEFAVFELGSNIPAEVSAEKFEQTVTHFLTAFIKAHPHKTAFVIDDLLILQPEHAQRHEQVLHCLQNLNAPNLIYINGYEMLPDPDLIAADFTHPTVTGHQAMADFLIRRIEQAFEKGE